MRELFDDIAGRSASEPSGFKRQEPRATGRKRFYTTASVSETADGFVVLLDGRPIRTPSQRIVAAPVRVIAALMAAEWAVQADMIDPTTMPVTRLGNSVIDGVTDRVGDVKDDIAKYFASDLLCYRAGHPQELVAREAQAWDGVLEWASDSFGARFILAEGIMHADQPARSLAAARAALPDEAWAVAAVHVVTTITGSALLALALYHGARDADAVWAAAHVDDDWNAEHWGMDDEVAARRAARLVDFRAAADVIAAMRSAA